MHMFVGGEVADLGLAIVGALLFSGLYKKLDLKS